jgi:hypothetical protein
MNYGMALRAAGRPRKPLDSFDRALAIQPNMAGSALQSRRGLADLQALRTGGGSYDRAWCCSPR